MRPTRRSPGLLLLALAFPLLFAGACTTPEYDLSIPHRERAVGDPYGEMPGHPCFFSPGGPWVPPDRNAARDEECVSCGGMGRCEFCLGMGYRQDTRDRRVCPMCEGMGRCPFCKGTGQRAVYVDALPDPEE